MTELEFKALANQGYNRIPLIAEGFADLDTPLSLYLKLCRAQGGGKNSYLLESVVGGERFGRYSFIGLPARTEIRSTIGIDGTAGRHRTEVLTDGRVVQEDHGDPLAFIERFAAQFKVALRPGLPRFCGGLAGYFGYDTVRLIEKKLAQPRPDDLGLPDIHLLLTEELAVIDNLAGRIYLIVYADPTQPEAYQRARERIRELRARIHRHIEPPHTRASVRREEYREFAKDDYLKAVARTKEYIAAGDVMQVQIGQRIRKQFADSPLSLYRALRTLNPSPYMYFYDLGEVHVVGASPEILVRSEDRAGERYVAIRPIAGTRPRGANPEADQTMAEELLADPKERAEHLMLIDLARNDIGRIAVTGSVHVTEQMVIERYSHVMHLVSHVEGKLQPGMTNLDVLRATFPAGTLSGAPKVRAMEIIDELEPGKRGIYGGAVGYLSFAGDMDLAIAIRTGVIKGNVLYAQAAAGIVADSVPEMEWRETEAKARAVLRAAEQVEDGFDVEI
ncbi:MAG TPA: anthranilate synthase component I [Burkholderiaceae bacterium]|nr:anthranilate synthase component I [Burkholderiaceae bacterium]